VEFAGAVSVSVTGASVTVIVGVAVSTDCDSGVPDGLYCLFVQHTVTKLPLPQPGTAKHNQRMIRATAALAAITLSTASYALTTSRTHSEAWYVEQSCAGEIEVVLSDRTRVDCLTDQYAIEYDFTHKWAEAIGQALHYGLMTGKRLGIVLIGSQEDAGYQRAWDVNLPPIVGQKTGENKTISCVVFM